MNETVYAGRKDKQHKYNNGLAGKGESTKFGPHPDYPFKYGSTYFRTEEGLERFRRIQLLRKSAKRLGWPHETEEELDRFEVWRDNQKAIIHTQRKRRDEAIAERMAIRKEFGLHKSSNLYNFQAVMAKNGEVTAATRLIAKQAQDRLTDADKVELIKKMIEDKTPIMDFMIRTSQLVGAKL